VQLPCNRTEANSPSPAKLDPPSYTYIYVYISIIFYFFLNWRLSAKQAAQPLMQSINASTQPRTKKTAKQPKPNPTHPRPLRSKTQKPRRACGRRSRRQAKTRTNEQARQPKPKPDSTTAAQVKDPKAMGSMRETVQAGTNTAHREQMSPLLARSGGGYKYHGKGQKAW